MVSPEPVTAPAPPYSTAREGSPTTLYLLMTFHSHSSDAVTFLIRSTKNSQHFCVMLVYVSSAGDRR